MLTQFKSEDLARLAAYIDGEGCISIEPVGVKRSHRMQVAITNTDVRLVVWLKDTFGGEYRAKGKTNSRRRIWYWYAGSALADELLKACLPYFIMKRDQAEIAIAFRRTVVEVQMAANGGRLKLTDVVIDARNSLVVQLKEAREDAAPVIQ